MRYIGVTRRSINQRYKQVKPHYFTSCYLEAPENFTFQIIPCDTIELALELEELIVDIEVVKSSMFYNMTIGGHGYPAMTDETKAKISESNKGRVLSEATKSLISTTAQAKGTSGRTSGYEHTDETKALISLKNKGTRGRPKGYKLSDEAKAKISAGTKGRKLTPEHRSKISASNKGVTRSGRPKKESTEL